MQPLIEIDCKHWDANFSTLTQKAAINAIENGKIILFPKLPFVFSPNETEIFSRDYQESKSKNISFNCKTNTVKGMDNNGNLKRIMQRFSKQAFHLIENLCPHYTKHLQIGRTSFRPIEIAGRVSSYRKDDTRLHVDAFPATPLQGRRILRVFTNIHPEGQQRIWRVGEPFIQVAERFLPFIKRPWLGRATLLKLFKITKGYSTAYDYTMLQIHNQMKADCDYQKTVSQSEIHFAPGNTWITQTDCVSHAAMSGKFLLEQTFYLPVEAMLEPAFSPLRILEKTMGRVLI